MVYILLAVFSVAGGLTHRAMAERNEQRAFAQDAFRLYNPKTEENVVDKFMEVTSAFGLDGNGLFSRCVSQICLESGAHPGAESGSGAMGFCQITPRTAFHVLNRMSQEDRSALEKLGCSSMEWASGKTFSRQKAITWLWSTTNNIALWGLIMSQSIKELGADRAFLAYRLGKGGARRFVGDPARHPYLVSLTRISKKIQKERAPV